MPWPLGRCWDQISGVAKLRAARRGRSRRRSVSRHHAVSSSRYSHGPRCAPKKRAKPFLKETGQRIIIGRPDCNVN